MCLGGGPKQPAPQPAPAPAPPPANPASTAPLQAQTRIQERRTRNQTQRTRRTGVSGVGPRFGGSSFAPSVFGETGTAFPV